MSALSVNVNAESLEKKYIHAETTRCVLIKLVRANSVMARSQMHYNTQSLQRHLMQINRMSFGRVKEVTELQHGSSKDIYWCTLYFTAKLTNILNSLCFWGKREGHVVESAVKS